MWYIYAAAAAKSHQLCPTLCDPIDSSPPGSPVPGILQARILEWIVLSFSSAWKWKVKVKSLSRVRLFATPWTVTYQAPLSVGFPRQEYWSGVPLPSLYIYAMDYYSVQKTIICMCVCVYMDIHRVLLSYRKEWSNVFCNNMDGPIITQSEINTPSEVSQTKTNIWHCLYVESKKRDKHTFIFKT